MGRLTRLALALTGSPQLLRVQLSFYHGMALSALCNLLAVPDYLTVILKLLDGPEYAYIFIERVLKVCGSVFTLVLNILLAVKSLRLQGLDSWCIETDRTSPETDFTHLGKTVPTYRTLLYHIAFDAFFLVLTLLNVQRVSDSGVWRYWRFCRTEKVVLLGGVFHTVVATVSLASLIQALNDVTETDNERKWGFGQIVTMTSVGFGISFILLQYSLTVGTDDLSVPRYVYWYRRCTYSTLATL